MNLLDDNLFVEVVDDIKTSIGLGEEDKDLLKSLEKMAEEVENEADNPTVKGAWPWKSTGNFRNTDTPACPVPC